LIGIIMPAAVACFSLPTFTNFSRRKRGWGDIKLLAMMGAFLGWMAIPFIIFASSLVGSVVGITLMLVQKKDSKLAIPFGPFLAFGAILYVFYGRQIIRWYLNIT
jgi:leader peptidase (prepilin peptidase)/N-methyltransferase